MERNYTDIITGTVLMALSIVMFVMTFNIEALTDSRVGASFIPRIISVLIAIMSIPVIVTGFGRRGGDKADKINSVSDSDETSHSKTEEPLEKENSYIYVIVTIVLLFVYLYLIPIIGFLIATSAYLIIQMLIFSEWTIKNMRRYAVISIITSTIIYYVFRNAFYVMLPAGILG